MIVQEEGGVKFCEFDSFRKVGYSLKRFAKVVRRILGFPDKGAGFWDKSSSFRRFLYTTLLGEIKSDLAPMFYSLRHRGRFVSPA